MLLEPLNESFRRSSRLLSHIKAVFKIILTLELSGAFVALNLLSMINLISTRKQRFNYKVRNDACVTMADLGQIGTGQRFLLLSNFANILSRYLISNSSCISLSQRDKYGCISAVRNSYFPH